MRNPSLSKKKAAAPAAAEAATPKTTPCCSKVGLKRGPWTPEEDELLSSYIGKEGEGRWRTLPKRAGLLRCGKSCRLRWMNYLRPSVKRGQIAPDEEDLILRLHRLLGNRWSLIAGRIPGRTDNEIKNYWNTHLSKKLIGQGIDPRTHKPLDPDRSSNSSANPTAPKAASSSEPKNDIEDGYNGRNSNPSPGSSPGEETSSGSQVIPTATNKELSPFKNHDVGHDAEYAPGSNYQDMMGMRCNDDEDLNCYGGDDVFSSFLNSLITEEAFPGQHGDATIVSSDPLIAFAASSSSLGLGNGWESTMMASVTVVDNKKPAE
ncbi:hypothetical protein MLD38_009471 [Melastoma candidum]|uniref:Uncharacterized protein n=1 Tax=Melastoma candidum TaxID=119954 RepID=A0ACB9S665_9MYRT|nr:hypothetical protein MLD38_009471 [Melastoma candidum]